MVPPGRFNFQSVLEKHGLSLFPGPLGDGGAQCAMHCGTSIRSNGTRSQSQHEDCPKPPGLDVGKRTKVAIEIRQLGRSMLSPGMVVFGLGRGDLRDLFLIGYANLTQNFRISGMVKVAEQHRMLDAMRCAVSNLATLAGLLRMLFTFLYDRRRCPRWKLGRAAARLHIKVFAAHTGWRFIPSVVRVLPDLLLPREIGCHSVGGVIIRLRTSRFCEPLPRSKKARPGAELQQKQDDDGKRIWRETIEAVDSMARMMRMEILEFAGRIVSWDAVAVDAEGHGHR
jgi:hypothetical protein